MSDQRARWAAHEAVVREMLASVSRGEHDAYLARLADDVVYEAPFYPEMEPRRGRAEVATMLENLMTQFSSVEYTVTQSFESVDPDLVIVEARGDNVVSGTDTHYRNHYVMFVWFSGDAVTRWTEYSNPNVYRAATGDPGR